MDTTRHIWSQPGTSHLSSEWGKDRRPFYKRMFSKVPFSILFFLFCVALVIFSMMYNSRYTYEIKQGRTSYYTNSYRKTGGCIMFPDGSNGDSTQVCGAYTLIKQH